MQSVYLLRDPRNDAPRYVGVTNNLKHRIEQHCGNHARHGHCKNWITSLRNLGMKPLVEILEVTDNQGRSDAEKAWILGFRQAGADLVNLTDGGEGNCGWHPSPETRAKISLAHSNRSPEFRAKIRAHRLGKKNCLGHKVSPETRAKISAKLMGNKNSLGYHPSEETLKKRKQYPPGMLGKRHSQGMLGKRHSQETKDKIRAANIGYVHSEETRSKLSLSLKGNRNALGATRSIETRAKMSVARKATINDKKNRSL